MTDRERLLFEVIKYHGAPYLWGGSGPGFDCSGLICRVLWRMGLLPWGLRLNSGSLYRRFQRTDKRQPGNLVFWGPGTGQRPIRHVEFVYDDEWNYGAELGGPTITTFEAASRAGAMVDFRPHKQFLERYGEGWFRGYADPFLERE